MKSRQEFRTELVANAAQYPQGGKARAIARNGVEMAVDREIVYDIHDGLGMLKLNRFPKHPDLKEKIVDARKQTLAALEALDEAFWS